MPKKIPERYKCMDCQKSTWKLGHLYTLRDDIWRVAVPKVDGMLCLPCLAGRLAFRGHKLNRSDFMHGPSEIMMGLHGDEAIPPDLIVANFNPTGHGFEVSIDEEHYFRVASGTGWGPDHNRGSTFDQAIHDRVRRK
jgi:hypothetical protein